MHLASLPQAAHLQRRQTFNLNARKGQRIECRTGQLWITQDGDPRDVILDADQCFTLDRSGHALVSALKDASFVLRSAADVARTAQSSPRAQAATGRLQPGCAY
jgi:hypothetical protein